MFNADRCHLPSVREDLGAIMVRERFARTFTRFSKRQAPQKSIRVWLRSRRSSRWQKSSLHPTKCFLDHGTVCFRTAGLPAGFMILGAQCSPNGSAPCLAPFSRCTTGAGRPLGRRAAGRSKLPCRPVPVRAWSPHRPGLRCGWARRWQKDDTASAEGWRPRLQPE